MPRADRPGMPTLRRLLHLSDIHFGPPHVERAADGVARLVEECRPDLVVVSGDLTQRAKPRQFEQARRFLDGLGLPFLAVPGNHDVPMYRFWERFLDRFGAYRRHFDADIEPCFVDDELEVVGFNTAFSLTIEDGRFTRRQLAGVTGRFGRSGTPDGNPRPSRVRVAVAHHPLGALPELMGWRTAFRSAGALRAFAAAGVDLVLSGHVHVGAVGRAPGVDRQLWLIHSGTSTSDRGRGEERGRMTCNLITIEASPERRAAEVEQRLWSDGAGRFVRESVHDCKLE